MKKLLACLLAVLLIGCVSPGKKDTTSDLERLAEGAKGKWSDYADYGAGEIINADTFLVRDSDDATTATGIQKEYPWSVMKSDLKTGLRYDCEDLAEDTWQGETYIIDCGEAANCAVGDIVYIDPSDGDPLKEADATVSSGKFPAFGIVVVAGNDGSPTVVMTKGCYRNDDGYNWTITAPTDFIYLGESVGTSTQTAPSTSGDCVQIIGYPINADVAHYDFTRPYSEVE